MINAYMTLDEIKEAKRNEHLENLYKSDKASYMMLKKSFAEIEEKLITLQEISKLPGEEIINAQKATAIAETVINGAQAIIKGFAQLGPIAGAVNAGIQAGLTAVQVGVIGSQQYVPMLAKGGIVDGATLAVIGEAGKEAVMPLENNTGWIKELAFKINEIMQKDFSSGIQPTAYAGATITNNYYNNYEQIINAPKQLTRKEIYRDSKNLLALKGV